MPLVSRRNLISAGVTAGATALLPRQLFSLSSRPADSPVQSAAFSVGAPMEQAKKSFYSTSEQAEILNLARYALTELFEGKTLSELQFDADSLGIPSAERVNVTLRHAGRIRGSLSAPGANLGR